jgi:hypothetical protein
MGFDLEEQKKLWGEYIVFTRTTAIYPKEDEVTYLILGICSELGELEEANERIEDKITSVRELDQGTYNLLLKELGDVCWYFARLVDACKLDMNVYVTSYYNNVLAPLSPLAIANSSKKVSLVKLAPAISRLADLAKKNIRDYKGDKDVLLNNPKLDIVMQDIFNQLMVELQKLSETANTILKLNKDKLSSRKDRGVIGGSGDER